jgi:TRAP-type C4-dicarboxylate transport system permease small subunit
MQRYYDAFLENLVFFVYLLLIVVGFLQVFFRYVLNYSLSWTEEVGRYSFVWLTFVGASLCVQKETHIGLDVLIRRFSDATKSTIRIIIDISITLFLVFLTYQGFIITLKTYRQVSAALHVPMSVFYLAIPVGGILMLINTLRVLLRHKREHRKARSDR